MRLYINKFCLCLTFTCLYQIKLEHRRTRSHVLYTHSTVVQEYHQSNIISIQWQALISRKARVLLVNRLHPRTNTIMGIIKNLVSLYHRPPLVKRVPMSEHATVEASDHHRLVRNLYLVSWANFLVIAQHPLLSSSSRVPPPHLVN